MRVAVIGGGPAGLAFALCLKALDARHTIEVFDQRAPAHTYGWGITLPRHTLAEITHYDEALREPLTHVTGWEAVHLIHRSHLVRIRGGAVVGIGRLALLQALQARCTARGVALHFNARIDEHAPLPDADLVVGADGARSVVRGRFSESFQPTISEGANYYTWLGTTRPFESLTLGFKVTAGGTFAFHGYPYSDSASTFIVECSARTWNEEGFDRQTPAAAIARLTELFADVLAGHSLLFRDRVKWARFTAVRTARSHVENVVLLGDALHAVHFSLGSGTMLAFQDAIALAESVRDHPRIDDTLSAFAARRLNAVDEYARFGEERSRWYERMDDYMHLEPLELAYALLSRTPEEWQRPVQSDGTGGIT